MVRERGWFNKLRDFLKPGGFFFSRKYNENSGKLESDEVLPEGHSGKLFAREVVPELGGDVLMFTAKNGYARYITHAILTNNDAGGATAVEVKDDGVTATTVTTQANFGQQPVGKGKGVVSIIQGQCTAGILAPFKGGILELEYYEKPVP